MTKTIGNTLSLPHLMGGLAALALVLFIAAPAGAQCEVPLIADGGAAAPVVGKVIATWDDTSQHWQIEYDTDGSWHIAEVHVHAACDPNDLPQTKRGNPRVGQFDFNYGYQPLTQSTLKMVSVRGVCDDPYFAAHAVVVDTDDCEGTVCREETAWAEGYPFGGRSWATYFNADSANCGGTPQTFADCYVCEQLDCLLNNVPPPNQQQCPNAGDVCTIRVSDPPTGRVINRACEDFATAQQAANANDPDCEDLEKGFVPGAECAFACDGKAAPYCNRPPSIKPVTARLFTPEP